MTGDIFTLQRGWTPLLVSVPHAGTELPEDIRNRLSDAAQRLPDTDWHVDRLCAGAPALGASLLTARMSRLVIDVNRPPEDESLYPGRPTTGLVSDVLFDGTPAWREGEAPGPDEVAERRERWWRPYHEALIDELDRIAARFGYAILLDAHSIRSQVPRLFDGVLPDLNIGTANGDSTAPAFEEAAIAWARGSGFTWVLNGRFIGGYITRHYGDPANDIHAVQLEMAIATYGDENAPDRWDDGRARPLAEKLNQLFKRLLDARRFQ